MTVIQGGKDDNAKCGLGPRVDWLPSIFPVWHKSSLSAVLASCFLKNMMALLVFRPLHVRSLCLVLLSFMLFAFDLYSSRKLEVGCGFFQEGFLWHLPPPGPWLSCSRKFHALPAISYLMPPHQARSKLPNRRGPFLSPMAK